MERQILILQTPLGNLEITAIPAAIKSVSFTNAAPEETLTPENPFPILEACKNQLQEYFSGSRKKFSITLDPDGTSFQKKVWQTLQEVPYANTISYGELAGKLGDKNLMRAVGSANGKNPVAIIIPCHRVIGAGGNLTGYAGGLWRKKWLLDLEQPEKQALLF